MPTGRLKSSRRPGNLLNAEYPAAVVAGNVETSSRVADLCLKAFGRALGQGTMNNFTLGNGDFTYYETLGGGQGAGPEADGPGAVHVAMSNTLNTPIEALEIEFPVRATEYSVRRESGGPGKHHGGDGLSGNSKRSIRWISPCSPNVVIISHRAARVADPGATGNNLRLPKRRSKRTGTARLEIDRSSRPRRQTPDRDAGRRRLRGSGQLVLILGVDVGGTFTDAVLIDGGRVFSGKAPTTPDDQSEGVIEAIATCWALRAICPSTSISSTME